MFVQVTLGVILVNKYKLEFPKFHAFYGFVAFYLVALGVTWFCYLRRGTEMGDSHI